ncbi:unnamed protein product [Gordionus sp. m RMFG-2023]
MFHLHVIIACLIILLSSGTNNANIIPEALTRATANPNRNNDVYRVYIGPSTTTIGNIVICSKSACVLE